MANMVLHDNTVSVYIAFMSYSSTLRIWLEQPGNNQAALADAIGKTQVAVSRYINKIRFPGAETARRIDAATDGAVPFALWQSEFMARSGIAA
jgi:transcriptional regulator with XRE-family HTH domain